MANRSIKQLAAVVLGISAFSVAAESAASPHATASMLGEGASCQACHTNAAGSAAKPAWQAQAAPMTVSPSGSSAACLSCHDGTVGSGHGMVEGLGDLSNDHPVGIVFASSRSGRGALRDAQSTPSGLGGTIASDLLVDGRVECTSCHQAHHEDGSHLRKSNERSALCLTCHDK